MMNNDRDSLLTLVARLYYLDELNQSEIAELTGVSRSQVSRMLATARREGIVHISIAPYEPCNGTLETGLCERYGLQRAIVIKTALGLSPAQVRRSIGYFAGPIVSEWIGPNAVVGVAGGRTLAELVRCTKAPGPTPHGITAVQLMGNLGSSVSAYDAAELTHLMAQRMGGAFYALSAPALTRDGHTRELFMAHANVQEVQRLFEVMQLAMVGIGSLNDSIFIDRGALSDEELCHLRGIGAVGEICGRFFDREGQPCQTSYHDRVIGIRLTELRQIPEVIGITNGVGRVNAIRAALMGRLVKSLIIDEQGAEALLN